MVYIGIKKMKVKDIKKILYRLFRISAIVYIIVVGINLILTVKPFNIDKNIQMIWFAITMLGMILTSKI